MKKKSLFAESTRHHPRDSILRNCVAQTMPLVQEMTCQSLRIAFVPLTKSMLGSSTLHRAACGLVLSNRFKISREGNLMFDKVYNTLARSMMALLFLLSAVGKVRAPAATTEYMAAHGLPALMLWPVIALELLGALALIIGLRVREVSWALAGFTLLAAVLFHSDLADRVQLTMALKNIAIVGGLLAIARRKHAAPANLCGLLHFAAPGRIDRASMAQAIMDESRRQGGPFTRVSPVSTEAFAAPAKRPANACLSSDIATRQLRLDWTPWERALEQSVRGILARG
jgi:putative oxidoreductase